MAWVVDSCVILDLAFRDPKFGYSSAVFLDQRRNEGLIACPISTIEISPEFGGKLAEVRKFLSLAAIDTGVAWNDVDTETAATAWSSYVALKRQSKALKRPIADILIGAFANRFQGLITRNADHFTPFFPALNILEIH